MCVGGVFGLDIQEHISQMCTFKNIPYCRICVLGACNQALIVFFYGVWGYLLN